MNLKDLFEAMRFLDDHRKFVVTKDNSPVDFIDDWSMSRPSDFDQLYVVSHEFGPCAVVCADSEQSAWEAWLDEQTTIPADEVSEAFQDGDPDKELVEGYEFQANFTGTGIVNVGHYIGIRKMRVDELASFEIREKPETKG